MNVSRMQSVNYSGISSRPISPASGQVDRSPPQAPVSREATLSQQLDDQLTSTLSNIRQQMSASGLPSASQQPGIGSLLDLSA